MIIFETSKVNYPIIEGSGILQCDGVTKNEASVELPEPMGMTPGSSMPLSIETIELIIVVATVANTLLKLILELIKQKKSFNLEVNGKKMDFSDCKGENEIKEMLTLALEGAK